MWTRESRLCNKALPRGGSTEDHSWRQGVHAREERKGRERLRRGAVITAKRAFSRGLFPQNAPARDQRIVCVSAFDAFTCDRLLYESGLKANFMLASQRAACYCGRAA
jgi:hypothetical protein